MRNLLGPPLRLRGPVTRADGGKIGVGRGYGGARIDLENLSTTDPHSRQLLAAQIIWTLSRAGINGPYVINADGAALDDRFADGWETSDVAATDPGAFRGAAAGLHALVGGSLVSLDGQRAPRVPGSFGQMPNQTAAALSRTGQEVASIVTLRPGAPDMASSLWVGPLGGNASQAWTDAICRGPAGRSTTRYGWWSTATTWCASFRTRRVSRRAYPSTPRGVDEVSRRDRRAAAVARRNPRRDGHRRSGDPGRGGADTRRRIRADLSAAAGLRARNTVVSLSWRTGDDIVVSRTDPQHPVSYVNLDGVNSDGPSRNLLMPVTTVAANPSTVYVADERGVLQLAGSAAEDDPAWAEVRAADGARRAAGVAGLSANSEIL